MVSKINSKLILGTVQFGLPYGINNANGQVTEHEVENILMEAFNNGIRILDTASAYGNAHQLIGKFHAKYPESVFEIITKLPKDFNPDDIEHQVEFYLKELNIKTIHTLMFHAFDDLIRVNNGMQRILEFKKQKIIGNIGVSIYNNQQFESAIENKVIDVIQIPFNLLDNINIRGILLENAKANGKIIHARSVFLQGLFLKDIESNHPIVKSLKPELIQLKNIALKEKIAINHLAMLYALSQNEIDGVLIGVDSNQQLKENLKVMNMTLNQRVKADINSIQVKDIHLLNPSLW
jgi:aryl-alcohol dehydrogenase-like predicted oxidoreductase